MFDRSLDHVYDDVVKTDGKRQQLQMVWMTIWNDVYRIIHKQILTHLDSLRRALDPPGSTLEILFSHSHPS